MKLETYQYKKDSGWNNKPDITLDSENTILLCFSSLNQDAISPELNKLELLFPKAIIVGCSSAGDIYNDEVYDDSISLSIIQFENTKIKQSFSQISDTTNSKQAGENLATELNDDELRSILVLSDGLAVNGTQLIAGLTTILPNNVVITGGLAGDGDRFEKTWVWSKGKIRAGQVSAIGFYGNSIGVGHGSRGGWDVLGPEREVTQSAANVLYELDNQPALELYKKYLGDRASGLPATGLLFPLSIISENKNIDNVVRTILAVDEKNSSITFAGDIPKGSHVQFMRANFDRLIDGAADASERINTDGYKSGPILSIAISCVGRRLVLGPRTEEELDAALTGMPQGTKQIGFYSYGEISPLTNGVCDLHNQTMTLTLIWENT